MKKILIIIIVLMLGFAQGIVADSWDAENYKPYNTEVVLKKTNLPIIFIDTRNKGKNTTAIHKDYRVAVRMKIIHNADGLNYADTITHQGQTVNYEGWVAIKYRGTSSFNNSDKKPYGFKTLKTAQVDGKKEKVELLGMPKDNTWVLLAPYHDRSLIRDVLMFQLARPYFEYVPKTRYCEMIIDGTYYGVYILCEKPSKGKNRLNLTEPGDSGDELTGDYLVEVDREDEPHFYLKYQMFDDNIAVQYDFPDYEDMIPNHPAQSAYIKQRFDDMEDALKSDEFASAENGYRKYIDVGSFIDYQLSSEFALNPDAYRLSTKIYKRRDSVDPRFKMTLWDFNMAFGNNIAEDLLHDEWMFRKGKVVAAQMHKAPVPFWWDRLTEDEAYLNSVKERWAEYRLSNYDNGQITALIDSLVNELNAEGACDRNYQAWPIWDKEIPLAPTKAKNYAEEIANLRQWIENRLAWIDKQLGFNPDDHRTGIIRNWLTQEESSSEADKATVYYDLMGRRLEAMPARKGMYIHNGKKIVK
jgi:spore coat protein CotH